MSLHWNRFRRAPPARRGHKDSRWAAACPSGYRLAPPAGVQAAVRCAASSAFRYVYSAPSVPSTAVDRYNTTTVTSVARCPDTAGSDPVLLGCAVSSSGSSSGGNGQVGARATLLDRSDLDRLDASAADMPHSTGCVASASDQAAVRCAMLPSVWTPWARPRLPMRRPCRSAPPAPAHRLGSGEPARPRHRRRRLPAAV